VSARTEGEAIAISLAEPGFSRSKVELVAVEKGKAGIFGFGSGEVRVRVTPLGRKREDGDHAAAMAKSVLQAILSLMRVPADAVFDKSGIHPLHRSLHSIAFSLLALGRGFHAIGLVLPAEIAP
jgi:predicted RNA-binding protein Jag